ncbi:MAG: hypothetical protein HY707_05860 [Ignavibacteriae bacterium]|nr:hypothetical protein [Ignavibacteriota bacterium]
MAERKVGTVIYRKQLSSLLELFRLIPQDGSSFPGYKPGQYIALSRENCKLTRKVVTATSEVQYLYELDEFGNPRRGSVTHSYSISSAPIETAQHGYLEFYVVLEMLETGIPGRLSESLFRIDPDSDCKITYVNKIAGDFTLDKRAAGFENVVLVGTGTGLAPFASMIKQLHYEAMQGNKPSARYTLFHANRTYEELAYHQELQSIEAAQKFDFTYVASVSRPTPRDHKDTTIGRGRANNILRSVFGMPLKEEEDLQRVIESGQDSSEAKKALEKVTRPVLPQHVAQKLLLERLDPARTVILTCGNPSVMEDIKYIADANNIKFEKEEW